MAAKAKQVTKLDRAIPYILIVAGIIGLISAFVITFDKFQLLKNPSYIPSCNLNPIISCGSVMSSKQGSVFGFPNSFIGLAGFPVLIAVGMAIKAGATFKRWFWLGLQAGTIFGLAFVHWLFFQSVYRIHALCPYCMAVWVATITSFWYVLLYNIDHGNIKLPKKQKVQKTYSWVRRHHLDILLVWFVIIAFFILKHFWYYYGHYF